MSGRRVLVVGLLWLAGLGAAPSALAQTAPEWDAAKGVRLTQTAPGRVVGLPDGALKNLLQQPRTVTAGPGEGGALLKDLLQGPGPKSPATVGVIRNLPWSKLGTSIIRGLPMLGTAITIAELLEAARCREGFGGGPECDLGQPESQQTVQEWSCGPGQGSSPAGACADYQRIQCTGSWDSCSTTPLVYLGNNTYSWTWTRSLWGETYSNVTTGAAALNGTSQQFQCPAIMVDGVQVVPPKGPDGLCPTGTYQPVPEAVAADRIEDYAPKNKGLPAWQEIINAGAPAPHDAPGFTVESPPQVVRDTTTHPDGSITVRDTSYPWQSYPDGYGWQPRIVVKDYAPGVTPPPPGEIDGGTVTEGGGTGPMPEIITCGLPNTPPCKIDEGGTPPPPPPNAFDPPQDPIDPLRALITEPDIPEVAWTWSFSLPTGCTVIPVGNFAGHQVDFDICRYQPVIHAILSMFWTGLGILAAWGMLSRTMGGAS